MDNQLTYVDQGSFLGLRALGHEPLQQLVWVFDRALDLEGLGRFHTNLGRTLLGRRIERSVLPFGRDRWVAAPHQADLAIAAHPRPRRELAVWVDEQVTMPLDPGCGPAWRLAIQPFSEGGSAVSLLVSHSIADGGAIFLSAAQAAEGRQVRLDYPPPTTRRRPRDLWRELSALARVMPDIARAIPAAVRVARQEALLGGRGPAHSVDGGHREPRGGPIVMPSVAAFTDLAVWDETARMRGGTSNALLAGVATRLALYKRRVHEDGMVNLNFPVSERIEGDTRANALTAIKLRVDPASVTDDLTGVRTELRNALTRLADVEHGLLAAAPLTLITPKRLLRKLEPAAVLSDLGVGCSSLGDVDPMVTQPDGSQCDLFYARGIEWPIDPLQLDLAGGKLFTAFMRVQGKAVFTVSAWQVGSENSRIELAEQVKRAFEDFGLAAVIE